MSRSAAASQARPRKVLVVDDGSSGAGLKQAGFEVVTRTMAVGTLAAILRERPDVVVLDIHMPLLSAEDVIAGVRRHPALHDTVVLLHSSTPRLELAELARKWKADDWLEKTDDASALVKLVRHWVASPRRRGPAPRGPSSGVRKIGLLPELLLACAPSTAGRLQASLANHFMVSNTDSGAEALRRICSTRPPDFVVIGTSLADLGHARVTRCAHELDPRWSRRLIVLSEASAPPEAGAVEIEALLAHMLDLIR